MAAFTYELSRRPIPEHGRDGSFVERLLVARKSTYSPGHIAAERTSGAHESFVQKRVELGSNLLAQCQSFTPAARGVSERCPLSKQKAYAAVPMSESCQALIQFCPKAVYLGKNLKRYG